MRLIVCAFDRVCACVRVCVCACARVCVHAFDRVCVRGTSVVWLAQEARSYVGGVVYGPHERLSMLQVPTSSSLLHMQQTSRALIGTTTCARHHHRSPCDGLPP